MREITDTKEIQAIELSVLKKIHAFCEANALRYSLCGGTLLGAIRHKGFIPWDDDIDIFMPRPDYERFCATFRADGVSLHTHENDADYIYPFAKVYDDSTLLREHAFPKIAAGVYVDVFPVDGFPDDAESIRRAIRERRRRMRWVCFKAIPLRRPGRALWKTLVLWALRAALASFPPRFFIRGIRREMMRHGFENQPFAACLSWGYDEKECLPAEVFSSFIDVDFVGEKFKAIVGWETYLKNLYGDYMQLPPPEKRVTHHFFSAWEK